MSENRIIWRSPSNIAIVKYWGKKGIQQGINPSISFTLSNSYTETEILYHKKKSDNKIDFKFYFERAQKPDFEKRILTYFESIHSRLELFKHFELEIYSKNTFPHSAGIASSASAMSSIVLALLSIEKTIKDIPEKEFYKRASDLSRLASGSAARSIYGGFTLWGKLASIKKTSDDYAIPFTGTLHPIFKNLQDSILIVRSGKKEVSSSAGHKLMDNHPDKEIRIREANEHCKELVNILKIGDFFRFSEICEQEALSLHRLMMTSNPSFVLMQAETLAIIQKIREYRKQTSQNICFTLDAGPNIHLIYPDEYKKDVRDFIRKELLIYCENNRWIDDEMGSGPKQIVKSRKVN